MPDLIDLWDDSDDEEEKTHANKATGTGIGSNWDLYDSGAPKHMSSRREEIINYTPIEPKPIWAADKRTFDAVKKGDLRIEVPNGERSNSIILKNVLHCLSVGPTLVSVSKIAAAGATVVFQGTTCRIFNSKNEKIGEIGVQGRLYKTAHQQTEHAGAAAEMAISLEEMHRRMGHVSPRSIKRMMAKKAFTGPSIDDSTDLKVCKSCEYGKATRNPISNVQQSHRATKFGKEIHSDL